MGEIVSVFWLHGDKYMKIAKQDAIMGRVGTNSTCFFHLEMSDPILKCMLLQNYSSYWKLPFSF